MASGEVVGRGKSACPTANFAHLDDHWSHVGPAAGVVAWALQLFAHAVHHTDHLEKRLKALGHLWFERSAGDNTARVPQTGFRRPSEAELGPAPQWPSRH